MDKSFLCNITKGGQIYILGSTEIAKLSKSEGADVADIPERCASQTVQEVCTVCLSVKGMVDVDAEVQKIEKLAKVQKAKDDLEKKAQDATYLAKVKPEIGEIERG